MNTVTVIEKQPLKYDELKKLKQLLQVDEIPEHVMELVHEYRDMLRRANVRLPDTHEMAMLALVGHQLAVLKGDVKAVTEEELKPWRSIHEGAKVRCYCSGGSGRPTWRDGELLRIQAGRLVCNVDIKGEWKQKHLEPSEVKLTEMDLELARELGLPVEGQQEPEVAANG